ncbi:MAG: carboxypeptidase regulatory-like domain-containing protein, partial [Lentimicrobiaceae bacterium]|nr:carboxypeptidase regulatory-like domain-containing protein [Lentimicrobiaceae bacterium]
ATEEELLTVEVWNIDGWHQVAEFKNTADMPWTPQHIDISQYAFNQAFKIRYTAHGTATADINKWQIDNISLYRETTCDAPTNFAAAVTGSSFNDVHLTWEEPSVVIAPGEWIHWDNGENYDGIGLTGGGSFMAAIRWDAAQIAQYDGLYLKQVNFFARGPNTTYTLKVWIGANAANLVVDQHLAGVQSNVWNTVTLDTPVLIDGTRDFWIGYSCDDPIGEFPAGCDPGPAIAGYGDMISLDGVAWESMATAYSLNYNWNLQGFVEGMADAAAAPLQPLTKTTFRNTGGIPTIGHLPVVANNSADVDELIGYIVYRDNVAISDTLPVEQLYYDDLSVPVGEYSYGVTAVYTDCESPQAGPIIVHIWGGTPLPFFEPWNDGFETQNWSFDPEQGNWVINTSGGNPAPTAEFNWSPSVQSYSYALVSPELNGVNYATTNVTLNFDLYLSDFSSNSAEKLTVEVWDGNQWNLVNEFVNASSIDWTSYSYDITQFALGHNFKVRFVANGADSYDINYWYLDNVKIYEKLVATLLGTVADLTNGTPIAGATVSAYGTGAPITAVSGTNGAYSMELEAGTYNINCSAQGYCEANEQNYTINAGANTLNFELGSPTMEVSPEVMQVVVLPNQTLTDYITINNNGSCELNWNAILVQLNKKASPNLELQIAERKNTDYPSTTEFSPRETQLINAVDDVWDLQFNIDVTTAAGGLLGQAGVEFDGTYFYTALWGGVDIQKFDINGNYIESFQVPGVSELRDLAYDGQYLYGGAASNTIYCIDLTNHTLVTTISSPVAVRAIAYDSNNDAFWCGDWDTDYYLVGRDGSTVDVITNVGTASLYGLAYDYLTGAPSLWLFDQSGSGSMLMQVDINTGALTGVTHDVGGEVGSGAGAAGGCFITTNYQSGTVTLGGLVQDDANDYIFGYELGAYQTWINIDPHSGVVFPGETFSLPVVFDATGLPNGTVENAEITFTSTPDVGTEVVLIQMDVVGIPEVTADKIKIYPNPAQNYLHIELPGNVSSLKLCNSLGQTVYEQTVNKNNFVLYTEAYESGVYFIQFTTTTGQILAKRIVLGK